MDEGGPLSKGEQEPGNGFQKKCPIGAQEGAERSGVIIRSRSQGPRNPAKRTIRSGPADKSCTYRIETQRSCKENVFQESGTQREEEVGFALSGDILDC